MQINYDINFKFLKFESIWVVRIELQIANIYCWEVKQCDWLVVWSESGRKSKESEVFLKLFLKPLIQSEP